MKKILFLLVIYLMLSTLPSYSADSNSSSSSWGENSSVFNSGFSGQEPVTDNKLKQTINMMKERSLSKKQKKIQQEVQPLSPSIDMDNLKDFAESEYEDNGLSQSHTVMIPMNAYTEEGIMLSPGYYKLSCRQLAKDEYVLDLTQGTKRVLSVKAKQTVQDLEQESISFCNAEIIDNNRIRLVYGSIDLNLVGYLYFK